MKKEVASKIFLFSVIGLFVLLFAVNFVAAAPTPEEFFGSVKDGVGATFIQLFGITQGSGIVELAVIKFLFWFLLFLIILTVSDSIPFLEHKGKTAVVISLVVSYLSVMYVTPNDFYTILISYTTMAIVITSIIPLAVILALTYKLSNNPSVGKIILQKVLMGTYALVLIWRLLELWGAFGLLSAPVNNVSKLAYPLYGGTLIIIGILIFFFDTVRGFILRQSTGALTEVSAVRSRKDALASAFGLRRKAMELKRAGDEDGAKLLIKEAKLLLKHAKSVEDIV